MDIPTNAKAKRTRSDTPKYPWPSLAEGDSFMVPADRVPSAGADSISRAGRKWASFSPARAGIKFVVRSVEGGVRAWCVARDAEQTPVPVLTEFTTESGVPLPVSATDKHAQRVAASLLAASLPWSSLKVGESFPVPLSHLALPETDTQKGVSILRRAAFAWSRTNRAYRDHRFTVHPAFDHFTVERVR